MDVKKIKKLLFILIVSIIFFNIETVNAEDTESVCKANTNTDYEKICLYRTDDEETISLVAYAGKNDFMIKVNKEIINSSSFYSLLPGTVTVNKQIQIEGIDAYIGTSIPADYSLCPPIIRMYHGSYTQNEVYYDSYLFGITDPPNMASDIPIVHFFQVSSGSYEEAKTFYLSDNGGVRNAKTCKVIDQNAFPSADDFDSEDCSQLIDEELMGMINKVLKYIRIIVPILVIVLGMVDFGRAVLAGKEDGMKKAQATFMKRIIIGVAIFLLPTLINLVLNLANTVWKNGLFNNSNCGIK